jgi:NAD(P)-dependent dehydrogenase (short-subunit alcohol dehydrogenase family)
MADGGIRVMHATARLLEGKTAVIYGGGGFIGRGVAQTFAREGARVFLVGRTEATLRASADSVASEGGRAHVAVVDTLDEAAIQQHAKSVVDEVGGIDVSFNLISRGDVQGTRLLEMNVDDFVAPTVTGLRSNFITARTAARHMIERGRGVILLLTSGSGQELTPPEFWPMGGTGPADAAIESFMRYLASEVGPKRVRANCIWTAGVALEAEPRPESPAPGVETAIDALAEVSMLRKRPTLREVADAAAFLASDRASGITASILNVSSGISSSLAH